MKKTLKIAMVFLVIVSLCMNSLSVFAYGSREATPEQLARFLADKTSSAVTGEKNVYNVEIKIPAVDRDEIHDEVILMIDGSYSMDEEWENMKSAIVDLGEMILDGDGRTQITVMAFGMSPTVVAEHIKSVEELEASLPETPGDLLYGVSATNCDGAFRGVQSYIENHDNSLKDAYVVYITDGGVNANSAPVDWLKAATELSNDACAYYQFGELCAAASGEKNISEASKTVFGDDLQIMLDNAEICITAEENSDEYNTAYAAITTIQGATLDSGLTKAKQWLVEAMTDVFENAGLNPEEGHGLHVAETAYLDYQEKYNVLFDFAFYETIFTTTGSAAFRGNSYAYHGEAARVSGGILAEIATKLYVIQYGHDGYGRAGWMSQVEGENVEYLREASIATLAANIKSLLAELAETEYTDLYVTDYMSKWVNLIPETVRVVDGNGKVVAEFDKENSPKNSAGEYTSCVYKWTDGALCANKAPIVLDLVPASGYSAGGNNVAGNTSGDIYRITWNVKDGMLSRVENYKLQYRVKVDTNESGLKFETAYPANGNTIIHYNDNNGAVQNLSVDVPTVKAVKPEPVKLEITGVALPTTGDVPQSTSFALVSDNKIVAKVVTDEEGNFNFDDLVFEDPGTYEYQIMKLCDDGETIAPDDDVYVVIIDVTPTEDGLSLQTYVTYEKNGEEYDGEIAFTDVSPKAPEIVNTGDDMSAILYSTVASAVVLVILASGKSGKK